MNAKQFIAAVLTWVANATQAKPQVNMLAQRFLLHRSTDTLRKELFEHTQHTHESPKEQGDMLRLVAIALVFSSCATRGGECRNRILRMARKVYFTLI
jgi:hypothetical protein